MYRLYPVVTRRDPSNRRLNEHGIWFHYQKSNSQSVLSQMRAGSTVIDFFCISSPERLLCSLHNINFIGTAVVRIDMNYSCKLVWLGWKKSILVYMWIIIESRLIFVSVVIVKTFARISNSNHLFQQNWLKEAMHKTYAKEWIRNQFAISELVFLQETIDQLKYDVTLHVTGNLSLLCCGPTIVTVFTSGQTLSETNCNTPFYWKLYSSINVPVSYTDWSSGNPIPSCLTTPGDGNQNCIHYLYNANTGGPFKWDDVQCSYRKCVLCEYER